MTATPATAGDDLRRRAKRIVKFNEQIGALQADLKLEKLAAKNDGYDTRALMKVVKELAMDPHKHEAQLEFELMIDTYRGVVGLDTLAESAGRERPSFVPPVAREKREDEKPASEQKLYHGTHLSRESKQEREKAVARAKADKYIKEEVV